MVICVCFISLLFIPKSASLYTQPLSPLNTRSHSYSHFSRYTNLSLGSSGPTSTALSVTRSSHIPGRALLEYRDTASLPLSAPSVSQQRPAPRVGIDSPTSVFRHWDSHPDSISHHHHPTHQAAALVVVVIVHWWQCPVPCLRPLRPTWKPWTRD